MSSKTGEFEAVRVDEPAKVALRHTPPVRRAVYASAGVVLVGIGGVGVIVPGLPTAIWLMGASYCFARSNPRLEERLIRNRFFGPYLQYLDSPSTMPRRVRWSAIGLMWISVAVSMTMLALSDRLPLWLGATFIAAAALGTWVILRLGRVRLNAQS